MNIQQLANNINAECEKLRYFYAYGLIRETFAAWQDMNNRKLLSLLALDMIGIASDDPLTKRPTR